jgi:hypothetical protein
MSDFHLQMMWVPMLFPQVFHTYITDHWRWWVSHCHTLFLLIEFILVFVEQISILSLFLMTCKTSSTGTLVNRLMPKLTRKSLFWRLISCINVMKCSEFFMKDTILPTRELRIGLPPAFTLVSCQAYSTLMMEAISFSETSADFQHTTWRYMPEDSTLHNRCCGSLKFYIFNVCLNSHRWFMLCLVYVTYLVLVLVSGDRDKFYWLSPTKQAFTWRWRQFSLWNFFVLNKKQKDG